jgi:hypothetical protein
MHLQIPNTKTYNELIQGQSVGLVLTHTLPSQGDLVGWSFLGHRGTAKIVKVMPEQSVVNFVLYAPAGRIG